MRHQTPISQRDVGKHETSRKVRSLLSCLLLRQNHTRQVSRLATWLGCRTGRVGGVWAVAMYGLSGVVYTPDMSAIDHNTTGQYCVTAARVFG